MDDALDLLEERTLWQTAPDDQQDAAIEAVLALLGPAFTHVATARHACGGQTHRIATLRHGPSGVELQLIPGGSYRRGTPEDHRYDEAMNWWSEDKVDYENPRLLVQDETVRPLLVGRAPLSREEWRALGGDGPGGEAVLTRVPWATARARLEAAPPLRLPTEAEWEWACRAGVTTAYPWGDAPLPPGQAPPANAFGLSSSWHDDVWEWVAEEHVCTYRWRPDLNGGPGTDVYHVTRGESCARFAFVLADRDEGAAEVGADVERLEPIGVRVCASFPRRYRPDRSYSSGERVVHPKFGAGLVTSAEGRKVQIRFDDGQTRTLAQAPRRR